MSQVLRLRGLAGKSFAEQRLSIRFHAGQALSRLPVCPTPFRLVVDEHRDEWFLWHRFEPQLTAESKSLEYVSSDNPELRFLCRYLKPGMTFLDVGSHHGLFAVLAAKCVGMQGRVIAFEPSARDCGRLKLNRILNAARQIKIEPLALGAQTGPASFYVVLSGYTTMNSLRPPVVDTPVEKVQVDMIRLDDYAACSGLTEISLIKIDAEGAEMDIFAGAEHTIQSQRPVILCEVLDAVAKAWGRPGVASIDHLEARGYEWFAFRESGFLQPHHRREEYPEVKNYLAVPREKVGSIQSLIRR